MSYIADQRLYLTADDRVVEAGDPDARWLLVAAGSELPDAVAAQYGLIESDEAPESEAVEDELAECALGGGWFEIDGEKVQGRDNALALLAGEEE